MNIEHRTVLLGKFDHLLGVAIKDLTSRVVDAIQDKEDTGVARASIDEVRKLFGDVVELLTIYERPSDDLVGIRKGDLKRAQDAYDAAHSGRDIKTIMTLTGHQLRTAVAFANPDKGDRMQLESEVTFAYLHKGIESDDPDEAVEPGLRVYFTEYPEEGSIPLPPEPPGSEHETQPWEAPEKVK